MSGLSTAQAFLADIIANLQDDALRSIFADWLEEHGQEERAELIRVQIKIASLNLELLDDTDCGSPGCTGGAERRELNVRMHHLLAKNGHTWLKTPGLATYSSRVGFPVEGLLSKKAGGPGIEIGVTVRRGFVAEVRLPCATWMEHGPTLVRHHPLELVELAEADSWLTLLDGNGVYIEDNRLRYNSIPLALYDCLQAPEVAPVIPAMRPVWKRWLSMEDARTALSQACLTWAKEQHT